MTAQPTFALVAGEASGDQLGAALIGELKKLHPGARFTGIGGRGMRAAGMESWWDSEELAVFGLFEVLAHFPRLLRIRRELRRRLQELRPDVFIGIDAPDFNLGLEQQLKSAGIRTVHYVSPAIWAWRGWRVRKIARAADLVLCLFPFEPSFYQGHGISAAYVGHPMADQIPLRTDATAARRELGLDPAQRLVALLPGSRAGEVARLSAPMIEAAALLSVAHPDLGFVAAIANPRVGAIFRSTYESRFPAPAYGGRRLRSTALNSAHDPSGPASFARLPNQGRRVASGSLAAGPAVEILLIEGRPRTVMAAADVVICASGTATLETMLIKRPLVVAYRLAATTYQLLRSLHLFKSRFFALPNILAGEALVPELVQHQATGPRLARETTRWLQDEPARLELNARFEALHRELLGNASQRAASAIGQLLQHSP